jgi:hypothetical protein
MWRGPHRGGDSAAAIADPRGVHLLRLLFDGPLALLQAVGDAIADAVAWSFGVEDGDFPDDDHDWL